MIKREKILYLTTEHEVPSDLMSEHDQRTSKRLLYEAPVTIENCDTGEYFYGRMYNYSLGGMYFETDCPLAPGAAVRVAIRKSAAGPGFDHFRATVKWCREISDAVVLYSHSIGIQYLFSFSPSTGVGNLRVIEGGARNGRDD